MAELETLLIRNYHALLPGERDECVRGISRFLATETGRDHDSFFLKRLTKVGDHLALSGDELNPYLSQLFHLHGEAVRRIDQESLSSPSKAKIGAHILSHAGNLAAKIGDLTNDPTWFEQAYSVRLASGERMALEDPFSAGIVLEKAAVSAGRLYGMTGEETWLLYQYGACRASVEAKLVGDPSSAAFQLSRMSREIVPLFAAMSQRPASFSRLFDEWYGFTSSTLERLRSSGVAPLSFAYEHASLTVRELFFEKRSLRLGEIRCELLEAALNCAYDESPAQRAYAALRLATAKKDFADFARTRSSRIAFLDAEQEAAELFIDVDPAKAALGFLRAGRAANTLFSRSYDAAVLQKAIECYQGFFNQYAKIPSPDPRLSVQVQGAESTLAFLRTYSCAFQRAQS